MRTLYPGIANAPFRALLLVSAVALLGACGAGEANETGGEADESTTSDAPAERAEEAVPVVASGTLLTLELDEAVSTSSHDAGDRFTATVAEPVREGGSVVVPSGAKMVGVVEESARSDSPENRAVLALQFDRLRVEGETYPVTADVEVAEPRHSQGDSGAETAAKIAIGTAAGALVGQIVGGDTESTIEGAAAGTVAGSVVAIASRDGDATLPEGSRVTVRIREPVRLD